MDANLTSILHTVSYVFVGFVFFFFGYLVGRLDWVAGKILSRTLDSEPVLVAESRARSHNRPAESAQVKPADQPVKTIAIDESKFVAKINTAGMKRADKNELGKTSVANDGTMQNAISKLAQLKGEQ